MPRRKLDPEKLLAALRGLERGALFTLASRAIRLLPASKLPALVEGVVHFEQARPPPRMRGSLLGAVRRFHDAAIAGEYYEDFKVNSKNYMEESAGTKRFIGEFHRLGRECIRREARTSPKLLRESLELLFDLLRRIDNDAQFVFFADEPGSFQVGADFEGLFPVYFRALASTAGSDEFARVVREVIDEFEAHNKTEHLKTARELATPEQAAALARRPRAAKTPAGVAGAGRRR